MYNRRTNKLKHVPHYLDPSKINVGARPADVDSPARSALSPRLVPGPDLPAARALSYAGPTLATTLGQHPVALMRGHGSVAAAQSVRHVVFRAVYTEVNARMESEALRLGDPMFLNEGEAAAAMKTNDGLVDRPWELWKQRAMGK